MCSPFPELRKIVENYSIGWLLDDPVTPEGIATAVNNITETDLDNSKEACASFIAKNNWEIYEERLIELYKNLLFSPETMHYSEHLSN